MITLKDTIIDEIKGSQKLRNLVQVALGISHTTLYKYLAEKDSKLANINVLEIIKANTNYKTDKELLTK
jgi:hypothetical protein